MPDKYQAITHFCVSDETLQKWSEYFARNNNQYSVEFYPDKTGNNQWLIFGFKQFTEIKKIRDKNKTATLVYEHNTNKEIFFHLENNKIYAGVDNQCINNKDTVNRVKY